MDRQVHRTWSDSSTDRATPPVAAAIQSLHLSTMQLPRDSWQNSSMSGGRAGKPSFATPNLSAALGAEPYGVDGADDGDVEAGGGGPWAANGRIARSGSFWPCVQLKISDWLIVSARRSNLLSMCAAVRRKQPRASPVVRENPWERLTAQQIGRLDNSFSPNKTGQNEAEIRW